MTEQEPQPEKRSVADLYDSLYQEKGPVFGGGKPDELVEQAAKLSAPTNVIEIGCGDGRNSLFLAKEGFDVMAVDLSSVGIEKLQETARQEELKIQTEVGDIRNIELTGDYGVIVSTYVLHHLPRTDALKLVGEIKLHTSEGGYNIITTFTQNGDFYRSMLKDGTRDDFYPATNELQELYNGWEVIQYEEREWTAKKKNPDGSPMKNVEARILARKPESLDTRK